MISVKPCLNFCFNANGDCCDVCDGFSVAVLLIENGKHVEMPGGTKFNMELRSVFMDPGYASFNTVPDG